MPRSCLPLLAFVALSSASGCVIGRPARPSRSESAQGPSAVPVTGSPVVPQNGPDTNEAPPGTPPKPGSIWVRGYWHWDGVSYVWQRGHWEQARG
ncbi:MAG TPA: YXWGXW repeat-containing protein [Polyangiaceae bacterium]